MNKLLVVLLGLCVLAGVYLALVPGPVDAVAYRPPLAPPMTGVLQPNEKLKAAELIGVGQVIGPEDVAVDDQGRIYGGTLDGRILRVDGDRVESFADTGGRPLGLHFDARGNLIVCDAVKGLLSVNVSGEVRVLVTEADGVPFGFTDDLDIASDGRIYFSDASSRHHVHDYLLDCIEARPYGRLLRFDPQTGETEVLLRELYFANGVALSPDEDFVLVNETYRYRVTRFWLKGPRKGQHDVFIDNLPGFPDGISSNRQGIFWVAMFTVRNSTMDHLHPHPWAKNLLARLPKGLWPKPKPYGLVLALDASGTIIRSLHDTNGDHLRTVTSVEEHNGFIYCGSLYNDRIGRLRVADIL
jgi:sugar lactone lactonase YvrE